MQPGPDTEVSKVIFRLLLASRVFFFMEDENAGKAAWVVKLASRDWLPLGPFY